MADIMITTLAMSVGVIALALIRLQKQINAQHPNREIPIKYSAPEGITLKKAHASDACYDLVVSKELRITENGMKAVDTGVRLELPLGYAAIIVGRSGQTMKGIPFREGQGDAGYDRVLGAKVWLGVGDSGYTGEYKVMLEVKNGGPFNGYIPKGARIAQMMIVRLPNTNMVKVDAAEIDNNTERNANGFGSSGY